MRPSASEIETTSEVARFGGSSFAFVVRVPLISVSNLRAGPAVIFGPSRPGPARKNFRPGPEPNSRDFKHCPGSPSPSTADKSVSKPEMVLFLLIKHLCDRI